jgi:site-specific DNA recombinase
VSRPTKHEENKKPTRFALYTRVSTEDQAKEGFSLAAQLDRLRHYVRAQGGEVAGEYVDEGHSGRTTKRPQYQRMMADIAKWDTLLVLKMDRIHRNSRNFMAMMDDLHKKGKEFASVTESLDTSSAMGRFVMDIIQRIAQLESDRIGEGVFMGMEEKAKQGEERVGPRPCGYDYDRLTGKLTPSKQWAPIVSWIFKEYAEDTPSPEIAASLAEQGILRRPRKDDGDDSKPGTPWTSDEITRLIANPVNQGHDVWAGIVNLDLWPPIVTEDVFWRANARRPGWANGKPTKRDEPLRLVQDALRLAGRRFE